MEIGGKRVLVTGAAGFIGSHLVEELLAQDCAVRAFVHYNSFGRQGWLDFLPDAERERLEIFSGDIRDPHGVREAMKDVEVVFHLAALIGIPYSYHSPDTYVETNLRGTLNVLQAVRQLGIRKLVHTSTSEVYGTAQFVPMSEEHPVNPQSPYAATKAGADFLALTFHRSFQTPVAVIRPFNTYGPRQSARAIVPTIMTQLLAGRASITLGSLHPTRDLTFVKDTAKGFVKAAESEEAVGQVVNLGGNREISIGELARMIAGLGDKPAGIVSSLERVRPEQSEVERLWADTGKAAALLRWKPEYTLERGLAETMAWFRVPGNLAHYRPDIYNI